MGVPRQVVPALLVGVLLCAISGKAAQDNRGAYLTLCALLKLTEKEVTLPAFVNPPEGVEGDLIKLNMTTADDDWYNLFSGKAEDDNWEKVKATDKFKAHEANNQWKNMYPKWNEAKKKLLEDAAQKKEEEKKYTRPPAIHQRKIAQARIRRIWKSYEETELQRKTEKSAIEKIVDEINKEFRRARAGADGGNVTDDSFNTNARNTACGGNGSDEAGKSLANDLTCLCTDSSTGSANICAKNLGQQSWANSDNGSQRMTAYKAIKGECDKEPNGDLKPTAHTIQKLLRNFTGLLGKGVATSAAFGEFYTLGGGSTGVTGGSCVGGTTVQICVNYKKNLHGQHAAGIPWVHSLDKAAELLEKLAKEENKIHALNTREEALRDAAWTAYDETKLPDPSGTASGRPTNQTGQAVTPAVAGHGGASNPGSDGKAAGKATFIPLFILPWTRLI